MTCDEMTEALAVLHWPGRTLAAILRVDESTVRRWQRGDRPMPEPVAAWLKAVAAAVRKLPPPQAPERAPGAGRPAGGGLYAASPAKPPSAAK